MIYWQGKAMLILLLAATLHAQVAIQTSATQADVSIDGQPYTSFFFGPDAPKPYLHPLRTADGTVVTRRFPMDTTVANEKRDHPHHRGLWFTHGDVNGWDFWANEKDQKGVGKGRGTVVLKKLLGAKGGKKQGSLDAEFEWKDGTGKVLLTERRRITITADGANRVIDNDILLKAVEESTFGDTKEGVFALRLARELEEGQTGTMRSASGASKEKNVWGTASPWVDYVGQLQGKTVGLAILDHPKNPRHPTYWHSRGYGLFAANIFGVRDFTRDKTKDGKLVLKAGETLRFRYRLVIHPGTTEEAKIADLFQDWAKKK